MHGIFYLQNLEMWAKLQDSTKMDLNRIRYNNVVWNLLEQGRFHWRAIETLMHFRVV